MPRILPLVLSQQDLPLAELMASRLDGELFGLESGYCPVDEIVSPGHRAVVATFGLSNRLIAEQSTAAWIWGAIDTPPARPQFCVALGARVGHPPSMPFVVREVVLDGADLVQLAGVSVTTPLRTAIDIARFSNSWTATEINTVRRLMTIGNFSSVELETALRSRHKLPAKRRALTRIDGLDAVSPS